MWICYFSEGDGDGKGWWRTWAYTLSTQYWIDLLVDFVTLAVFSVATWYAFNSVFNN